MEETNFVRLWNEQNEKIDQSLVINKRFLKEIISQKAESQVYSLIKSKVIGIVLAIVYLIVLGISLYYAMAHFSPALYYFVLSIGAIFLINIKALYDYIKHLIWLNTIDYQGSLTEIQQKLNRLHLSIVPAHPGHIFTITLLDNVLSKQQLVSEGNGLGVYCFSTFAHGYIYVCCLLFL
jgi:hypothetical protein